MKKFLLSIFAVLFAFAGVQAQEYSYTFSAKQFAENGTKALDDVSWTLAGDGGYWGYDGTKGQQFGSGSLPYKSMTLSTSDIQGTITKIVLNTSGAKSINATAKVSVGGADFGDAIALTTTATDYTFEGSASGEIVLSYTQTSSKAIYIKSITITYTTGDSGEGGDNNEGEGGGEEPETPTASAIVATYELTQEDMATAWTDKTVTNSYAEYTLEYSYGSWTGYFNFTKSGTAYTLGLNPEKSAYLQSPVSYGAVESVSIVITNASSKTDRTITLTGGAESKTITVPAGTDKQEFVFDGFETKFYSFKLTTSETLQISSISVSCPPSYTLSVSDAGYATLFLGFNADIVDGAKAYIVKTEGVGADKVTLTEITGTIPANTGVIVMAEQGEYEFNYSTENVADVTGNLLEGTLNNENIGIEAYVLSAPDGVESVGLYKAQMAGGVWLNNANKAYLPASAVSAAEGVASFSFRFEGDTTGIEEVKGENGNVKTIYDLTGRRVENITAPGIYIVGGVKRVIR